MDILDDIRVEMARQRMSISNMADAMNTNRSRVSSWFSGRNTPSIDSVITMAVILGCDIRLKRDDEWI